MKSARRFSKASGILAKRKLPRRVRASGFLASDVDALIQGGGGGV
jgi:hypothetical protein